ncbi:unnamed protein product [Rhodiola kirilowii]
MSSNSSFTFASNNILATASTESDASHQNFHFPKLAIRLDRSNYSLWRSTVRSALEAFGLDSFLTDTSQPTPTVVIPAIPPLDPANSSTAVPEQIIQNPDFAPWIKRDRLILLWIRSTLTTPLLGMVARASTSAEAWCILARTFHAQTGARQMHLRQQLQTLTKGSLSVLEYFEKKRAIVDSLSECMCDISDADFVAYLLYGLGSQYGAFRSALSMRTEPLSSDELLGLLLQEEQRLEEETMSLSLPSANAVSRSGGRSNRVDRSTNNRMEHDRSLANDYSSDRIRLQCQICKKSGHEALNCYQRLNLRDFPATNRNATAKLRPAGKSAFVASSSSPSDVGDPWFVDSGATHHVTADLSKLNLQSNYEGNDRLMVGDEPAGTDHPQRNR